MEINQYNGKNNHPGVQPIRVLFNNISYSLRNYSPNIINEFPELVSKGYLSQAIDYKINELPMFYGKEEQTPCIMIHDGKIILHEIFVTYLWCICFSIHTPFYKLIHEKYDIHSDPFLLNECNELLAFAKRIKTAYEVLDKGKHLNPELFDSKYGDVIGVTNAMCINALDFILCHEYSHAKYQLYNGTKRDEVQADLEAIKMLLAGVKDNNDLGNKAVAGLLGLGACMLLSKFTQSNDHPDSDKRISDFIDNIGIHDENNELWALGCFVYAFWENEYKVDMDFMFNNLTLSYEKRFHYLVQQ
jgi:hypothetical protein